MSYATLQDVQQAAGRALKPAELERLEAALDQAQAVMQTSYPDDYQAAHYDDGRRYVIGKSEAKIAAAISTYDDALQRAQVNDWGFAHN